MLLEITAELSPATDLGYLLHKNPARAQEFDLPFGKAFVFYPEASEKVCTAALLVRVDPISLVRTRRGAEPAFALEQYVNDRPYAASSFLSVAISKVYGTALSGKCRDRPDLVEQALPLRAAVSPVPARGGPEILARLFEPLGYEVRTQRHPLDIAFPEWGDGPYHTLRVAGTVRLRDLLSHFYILIPVLDDNKHYWVGDAEVDKLLRHGESWLAAHPERALIAERYLKHRRSLVDTALSRLLDDLVPDDGDVRSSQDKQEEEVERALSLRETRLNAVIDALRHVPAKRVMDLGCGQGALLRRLLRQRDVEEIVGVDVSHRALEIAKRRLHWDRLPERQRSRVRLLHGSLTYRDRRLEGFDAAAVVEVVEHLDPARLRAFERVLFEFARPGAVVLTTPNREYNVRFEGLPAGKLRHRDHRFEWTRQEFHEWANRVADRFGYSVAFAPVGPDDPQVGPPSQMGVFRR